MKPNPFIHTQLNTPDPTQAKRFYRGLFDWQFDDQPMGPGMVYTNVDTGSKEHSGGIQEKQPDTPTAWLSYVEVLDVKKSLAKAAKLGAKIVQPFQPIPGMGAFGIFLDPTGAALGVWEAPKKAAKKAPPKQKPRKQPTRR